MTASAHPAFRAERAGWSGAAVLLFWLLAAWSQPGVRWVLLPIALLLPLASPIVAPLFLLSSWFFFATMALPGTLLYGLRAWWLLVFLSWLMFVCRSQIATRVWLWVAAGAVVLTLGMTVGAIRIGALPGAGRAPVFEAAVAALWLLCILSGWGLVRCSGGRLSPPVIWVMAGAWAIAIGYGVAQAVLGLSERTVPADVWPLLQGIHQYEDIGRRPFASLTANGMAAVSILPIILLFARFRDSIAGVALVSFLALLVGILSLTRSYLALVVALIIALPFLQRVTVRAWLPVAVALALAASMVLYMLDPEVLSLALRLEGDVSSLRADLWSYTVANLEPSAWLFGMGFGSGVWERFLGPLVTTKDLASPHSALLETVGTFGILGLIVYLALGLTLLRTFWRQRSDPGIAAFALAALIILVREQVATTYVFSPSLLSGYFWMIFGMALGASSASEEPSSVACSPVRA